MLTSKIKSYLFIAISILWTSSISTQESLVEKLGYSKDTKLLIIHADDIGMAHSENLASIKAMTEGSVNSASLMVPCAWFLEVVEFSKSKPEADIGIHLTLTSEWKNYKWGPVAGVSEVPGLVDKNGNFYDNCQAVLDNATPEEVEKELRAQIERAKNAGLDPTHLDTHMGCVIYHPDFFDIYLRLGREYGILF